MRCLTLAPWLLVSLLAPGAALACSCWYPTVEEHVLSAEAAFSGRVVAVEGERPDPQDCYQPGPECDWSGIARIAVDELYKGPTGDIQDVHFGWSDGANCGWSFEVGEEVVIFAGVDGEPRLRVSRCSQIPFTRPRMRGEYLGYLDAILVERASNERTILMNEERPRTKYSVLESLIEMEQGLDNPFGVLEAIERLNVVAMSEELEQHQLDSFPEYTLLAVSAALRIGQYERAEHFMRIARTMASPTARSELLGAYLDFRLGRASPIEELDDWPESLDVLHFALLSGSMPRHEHRDSVVMQSIFHGARLAASDMVGSRLADVLIIGSSLGNLNLENASLSRVIVEDSELREANLSGAAMDGLDLRNVSLSRAKLDGAAMTDSILQNVNLGAFQETGTVLAASLDGAAFDGTSFLNVEMRYASLLGTDFSGASFRDVDLQFARYDCETLWPSGFHTGQQPLVPVESDCGDRVLIANLSNMEVRDIDFSGFDLTDAEFVGTSFQGWTQWPRPTSFANAILRNADFSLSGGVVDFHGADLANADFTNARIDLYTFRATEAGQEPARLSGARFRGTEIRLTNFYDPFAPELSADLSEADIAGAEINCDVYGSREGEREAYAEIYARLDPVSRGAHPGSRCPR